MPILLLHLYSGALTRTRKLRLIAAYARLGAVPRPEDGTQGQEDMTLEPGTLDTHNLTGDNKHDSFSSIYTNT